jgi:predicted phage tail protein
METLRTIRLYGKLGTQFGRVHRLAVENTAEAIRALCALIPGFERELMTSHDRGIRYACFLGRQNIGKDELTLSGGHCDIRIAPVLTGSKRAGVLQTFVGLALSVVGGVLTGLGYGAIGAPIANLGWAMVVGGVIQMLSPQPKLGSSDSSNNGASYIFTGAVNTTSQGNPVPVLYGRMIVGSAVISAGIVAEDQAYVGAHLPDTSIPHVIDYIVNNQ